MINPRALHVRLIAWHTLLLGCVLIGFGVYTYFSMEHYLGSSLQSTLLRRANQIAAEIAGQLPQNGTQLISDIERLYAPEANDRFIRITRRNDGVVYVSGTPKDLSFDPTTIPAIANQRLLRSENTVNNNRLYIAAANVAAEGGDYIVEVGESDKQLRNSLKGLMSTLALGFPVPLILAACGAYLLVQRSLSPVTGLMNAAENISLHNLGRRLPVTETGDKLEHLSRALNRMIVRLDDAFQQVSRFTADASHELRTPLTIMRGELESILRRPHLADDLRENLTVVLEEVERLAHIIEELLIIARIEAGEAKIEQRLFDLGMLVATTVEQMRLLGEEKEIALKVNVAQGVLVEADAGHIKQVVVNLLDNAIKFTPQKGAIGVNVFRQSGVAVLAVRDTGIGIAEEHLPHIFDRFYRTDKTRSRAVGGAGLGLSIVRSICLAHGGAVRVESTENKGSCFTVTLPLAQTELNRGA